MEMKTIKLSDKGQIAIPTSIREKMGIDKGDELIILQSGDKILLEKVSNLSNQIEDNFKDLLRFTEQNLVDVWDNKQDDVWNVYLK